MTKVSARLLGMFAALAMAFSMVSAGLPVSADDTPAVDFELARSSWTFDSVTVGYEPIAIRPVGVRNKDSVSVRFSVSSAENFTCYFSGESNVSDLMPPAPLDSYSSTYVYCKPNDGLSAGTYTEAVTITATTEDSARTASTALTLNFEVKPKGDSIAIDDTNLTGLKYLDGPVTLSLQDAGQGSGTVTWTSSDSSVMTISGNTATITGAGTVTVTATKASDGTYAEATDSVEVTVGKAPRLDFSMYNQVTVSPLTYGQTLGESTITGNASDLGTYAWQDPATVPIVSSTHSYWVVFTPSEQTLRNYEGIRGSGIFNERATVNKVTPEMTIDVVKNGITATITVTVKKSGQGDTPTGDVEIEWTNLNRNIGIYVLSDTTDADGNRVVTAEWDYSVVEGRSGYVGAKYRGDRNYNSKASIVEFDSTLPPKHKVTFDLDGGTLLFGSAELEVWDGEPVGPPSPPPTKSGHDFGGWYADSEYQTPYTFGEAVLKPIIIYAKFLKPCTVTFDLNGGTMVSPKEVTVYAGTTVDDPTDYPTWDYPEKDGWRFDGWYADARYRTPFDFDVPIAADTTIYAKYIKTYKVDYDLHGGLIGGEAQAPGYVVDEGSEYEIPAWADLEGWLEMPAGTVYDGIEINGVKYKPGDWYKVTGDVTIGVLWEPKQKPTPTGKPSPSASPSGSPSVKPSPTSTPTSPSPSGTPSADPTVPAPSDQCAADDPVKQEKVYRLYNPGNSEHLFTTDAVEYEVLADKHGWKQEGVAWVGPNSKGSSVGVYRLYNAGLGDHHYTKDQAEAKKLVSEFGWVYDNNGQPLFYSEDNDKCTRINVYRQYNGGLKTGQHHYTADKTEWDTLAAKHGWQKEGIGWYALSWPNPKG